MQGPDAGAFIGPVPDEAGVDGPLLGDERPWLRELAWLCGAPVVVSIAYAVWLRIAGVSAVADVVAVSVVACIALGGAIMNRRMVRAALRWPTARGLLSTLLVALVSAPTMTFLFWLLERLGFRFYSGYLAPYVNDGWPAWTAFVSMAVVTPLSEELLFRGLIQPKLQQIISPTEALIVQAALFSAAHLSLVILVTHFVMGLVFGGLRRKTGSLLPGVLLHAGWNAWVLAQS